MEEYKGIYYDHSLDAWHVQVNIKGTPVFLGMMKKEAEVQFALTQMNEIYKRKKLLLELLLERNVAREIFN